jgi:CDP-4-dehydro-6-deoxyglucose reductase
MSVTVQLAPSGHQIQLEENESILDAALRQGLMLPYSCRGGSCGACEGRVLCGAVDYPNGKPEAITAEQAAAGVALLCQARAKVDCTVQVRELGGEEAVPPRVLPARLMKKTRLAHDVMQLDLRLPPNQRLQFRAGQYIDLLLPGGKRRSFSLANPPEHDDALQLHIREVPEGYFSGQLEGLREKSVLRLEGPHGQFWLRSEHQRPAVFIAGGTGYAPLRAMLMQAFDASYEPPMHLFWGVRSEQDLYSKEAEIWAAQHDGFSFTPVLSEPDSDWQGKCGWVHKAVLASYPALRDYDVYMAGPPPMIEAAKSEFLAAGLPQDQLFFDSFEYAAAGVTGSSS